MSIILTQEQADMLLQMEKHRISEEYLRLPDMGGAIVAPLISADGKEAFQLDISRGRINLLKGKIQNRARTIIVLARIDFGGPPHRNPDDEEIACPHMHLYREGFGDRWAYPIDSSKFKDTADHWRTLNEFMLYCNITQPPIFERGLFS